jgi:Uncharacterized ACR, COG1993
LREMWGFHGEAAPHGDRLLQLGRRVPVVTITIDTPDRIATSFDIIDELTAKHGVVTSELVPALAASTDGLLLRPVAPAAPVDTVDLDIITKAEDLHDPHIPTFSLA